MNHAERKALKRAERKEPVYSLTASQINDIRQKAVLEARDRYLEEIGSIEKLKKDATTDALKLLISIPVLVLSDKYNFDEADLDQFMGYVKTWVLAINQDEDTVQEIVEEAKKVCSFEVEFI